MKFPETTKEKFVENTHGHAIKDDYRWLENSGSRRVKDWIREQNKFTEANISPSLRKKYEEELVSEYDFTDMGLPHMYGELYFWQQREPGQDQAVLYVKKGVNGRPRVLIDPNELNNDSKQTIKLDYWIPSPEGTYLAYGLSKDGDEMAALSVLDVNTSKRIESVAPNTGWLSLCWLHDESGFYYTAYPEKGTVPKGKELMGAKILFHLLGTKSTEDKNIFGKNRPKEDLYGLSLSYDDKWLIIAVHQDWSKNDLYVYDSAKKKVSKLITGMNALFKVSFSKDKAIMYTNYKADGGRLLVSEPNKMSSNVGNWSDFVDERKEKLEWYSLTADKILIVYQSDVSQFLLSHDHSGRELDTIPTADHSSLYDVSASLESAEFFYQYASFVSPPTINRYDPVTGKISLYYKPASSIDEKDYKVEQEWCTSKDGTRVPMFIIYRKEVERNGRNPTLLTAYGGFNYSNLPYFLRSYLPWLKRGGIYVLANIRGGGEFGEKWHEDGKLSKKQNSFYDFFAVAEYLIDKKYTSSKHLAIVGASNGGLMSCVSLVQRPELFRAVVSQVPLTDMVHYTNFSIATYWIKEYGDPAKKEDLEMLLRYSPYHNVNRKNSYPAILLTTATNDSRVDPMHARKMTALLQSTKTNNLVLLYSDEDTGHGGALTMTSFFRNHARTLAFLADRVGLSI